MDSITIHVNRVYLIVAGEWENLPLSLSQDTSTFQTQLYMYIIIWASVCPVYSCLPELRDSVVILSFIFTVYVFNNNNNNNTTHTHTHTQGVENTRKFLLEWLSFLYRYIPVGLLERVPQRINERPPHYHGRDDLETLMASHYCNDWVKIRQGSNTLCV